MPALDFDDIAEKIVSVSRWPGILRKPLGHEVNLASAREALKRAIVSALEAGYAEGYIDASRGNLPAHSLRGKQCRNDA